jgi:hypothetical protein
MANIMISDLQSLEAALSNGVSLIPSINSMRDLTEEELKIRGGSKGKGEYGEYEEYEYEKKRKYKYEDKYEEKSYGYEKKPYPFYYGS